MKIAVTSASGQLGAAIVRQLIQDTDYQSVVAIARTPPKAEGLGVEVRAGDYMQPHQLIEAFRGIDAVMMVSGNDQPDKRIAQHQNVIQAARKMGVAKIVYTSVVGLTEGNAFSPIIRSNHQTEVDIRTSGLDYVIGRNGIYIEPDLEYIDTYESEGGIKNSAGEGRCGYTSRDELAVAYSAMLRGKEHNGHTYTLMGEPVTQVQLANTINEVFGTQLVYHPMSVAEYLAERQAALGEFLGTVISGIYAGIRMGAFDLPSDYTQAAGRPHASLKTMMEDFKAAYE